MQKTIKTSRRNYNNNKNYTNNREFNNSEKCYNRKNNKPQNIEEYKTNFFAIKCVICSLCVLIILCISNINSEKSISLTNKIKSSINENISYDNSEDFFNEIKNIFNIKKLETTVTNRIDENIIEQMNNDIDVYYNNQNND